MATARGERGKFFEIRTRKYQIVPRFEGRNEVRKLNLSLHLRVVFSPPRGRGAKILAVPGQMKVFRSLETSEGGCLLPGERIRHNAAFEAAAGGLCRVSCFPPPRADARLHKVASSGQNGRTKPIVSRWLVLRNWLGNLELGQDIKTDGHLTTWTDLTSEAISPRGQMASGAVRILCGGLPHILIARKTVVLPRRACSSPSTLPARATPIIIRGSSQLRMRRVRANDV